MKLITPFTILNQNFHEIDLIRDAMKNRKLATSLKADQFSQIHSPFQIAKLVPDQRLQTIG